MNGERTRPQITFGPNSDIEIAYVEFRGFGTVFNGSAKTLSVEGSSFWDCGSIVDMEGVGEFSFNRNVAFKPNTGVPPVQPLVREIPSIQPLLNRKERRAAAKKARRN